MTFLTVLCASAATFTVTNSADSGPGTLREALEMADTNGVPDTIVFGAALNGSTIRLESYLNAYNNVSILGPGPDQLTIDGGGHDSVFSFGSFCSTNVIAGLTITNGASDNGYGGGIYNIGTLTVSNVTLSGNSAHYGGGIYNSGTLTIQNSSLTGNVASIRGGGIYNDGYFNDAMLVVEHCTLINNTAGSRDDSSNYSRGGGIFNGAADGFDGGCPDGSATVIVRQSRLIGNYAQWGGGICNYGVTEGGSTMTVLDSSVSENTSGELGAGIMNMGYDGRATATIQNSTVSNNWTSEAHSAWYLQLLRSILRRPCMLTVQNSTVSGNGDYGIINQAPSADSPECHMMTIQSSTVSGHSQLGVGNGWGTLQIENSLLANGATGTNFAYFDGIVTNSGYNLSDDDSAAAFATTVTNLLLGPLDYNGGPTRTHALLPGSPAIDAGDPAFTGPPDTDQRGEGFPRVLNGRVDIGAYEFVPRGIAGLPWVEVLTAEHVLMQAVVIPNGVETLAWFEWGLTPNYGNQTLPTNIGSTQTTATVHAEITGLTPATAYHYRLVTSNVLGVVTMGQDLGFGTPVLGVVQTLPASAITPTSAQLNGTARAHVADSYAWFAWGTTTEYDHQTVPVPLASLGTAETFQAPVTGLTLDTEYHYQLMVSNHLGVIAGEDQTFTTLHIPTTLYVWADNPNPIPPYATWATAATNIQNALDVAKPMDTVVVTNGVYDTGGTGANRILTRQSITVHSVNGPEVTVIDGGQSVRCVNLGSNSVLNGFTLTNGTSNGATVWRGGGATCFSSAVVTNCIITGNSAAWGGGVHGGRLYNCTLTGNTATGGGGAVFDTVLFNCTLTENSAPEGGAARQSTLNQCLLSGNTANVGGGASGGTLRDCLLIGNIAQVSGGGSYSNILDNCIIVSNSTATAGGGLSWCTANNCTLVGNSSDLYGGGVFGGVLQNCIVYYNKAPTGANYDQFSQTEFDFSCTTPLPTNGVGNITNAPLFVNTNGWSDLRLRYGSPGIDAGTDLSAILTTDLDGNPRPLDGDGDGVAAFDMGAYEFDARSMIPPDWFTSHGLDAADPQVVSGNPDLDPFTTFQEWLADTDPTNALSFFHIEDITKGSPAMISFPEFNQPHLHPAAHHDASSSRLDFCSRRASHPRQRRYPYLDRCGRKRGTILSGGG